MAASQPEQPCHTVDWRSQRLPPFRDTIRQGWQEYSCLPTSVPEDARSPAPKRLAYPWPRRPPATPADAPVVRAMSEKPLHHPCSASRPEPSPPRQRYALSELPCRIPASAQLLSMLGSYLHQRWHQTWKGTCARSAPLGNR